VFRDVVNEYDKLLTRPSVCLIRSKLVCMGLWYILVGHSHSQKRLLRHCVWRLC